MTFYVHTPQKRNASTAGPAGGGWELSINCTAVQRTQKILYVNKSCACAIYDVIFVHNVTAIPPDRDSAFRTKYIQFRYTETEQ